VDISGLKNKDENLKVKLNIRIPNESITNYDIDYNMTTILFSTNNSKVYLFDLPKAIENEKILSKRRLEIGVDKKLVYTYLTRLGNSNMTSGITSPLMSS
jgi:hypothetical protein